MIDVGQDQTLHDERTAFHLLPVMYASNSAAPGMIPNMLDLCRSTFQRTKERNTSRDDAVMPTTRLEAPTHALERATDPCSRYRTTAVIIR